MMHRNTDQSGLPHVVACWIASVDGRSTLGGRSSGLGSAADRAVFRGLRAEVDAILVGSRTAVTERYRRPGREPGLHERRAALGRAEEPTVLIASRQSSLPAGVPLLRDPDSEVRILTLSGAEPLRQALLAVRASGIRSVVCEGGPTLLGLLLAEDLLDELVVTTAPMFVGAAELPVLVAAGAHPLCGFHLTGLDHVEDHVFARYRRARDPQAT